METNFSPLLGPRTKVFKPYLGLRSSNLGTRFQEQRPRFKDQGTKIDCNKSKEVEMTAMHIADVLSAAEYYPFFLKAAWHLSQSTIETCLELAMKDKVINKRAYFITLARAAMK